MGRQRDVALLEPHTLFPARAELPLHLMESVGLEALGRNFLRSGGQRASVVTSTGHQTLWSLSCVCVHLAKLTSEGMVSLRARFDNEEISLL